MKKIRKILAVALSVILIVSTVIVGGAFSSSAENADIYVRKASVTYHYGAYSFTRNRWSVSNSGEPVFCIQPDNETVSNASKTFTDGGRITDSIAAAASTRGDPSSDFIYSIMWHAKNSMNWDWNNLTDAQYFAVTYAIHFYPINTFPYTAQSGWTNSADAANTLTWAKELSNLAATSPKSQGGTTASVSAVYDGGGFVDANNNYVVGAWIVSSSNGLVGTTALPGNTCSYCWSDNKFIAYVPASSVNGDTIAHFDLVNTAQSGQVNSYTYGNHQRLGRLTDVSSSVHTEIQKFAPTPDGKVIVTKKDSNGNILTGAFFKLLNNSTGESIFREVNSSGFLEFTSLPIGPYTLSETASPNGYAITDANGNKNEWSFYVTEANSEFSYTAYNAKQMGSITIVKEDVETGTTAQGEATLNGGTYAIYDSSNTLIQTVVMTSSVATSSNLPVGNYVVKETIAPQGYSISPEAAAGYNVSISAENNAVITIPTVTCVVKDNVIKGKIKITKTGTMGVGVASQNEVNLANVAFSIYKKTDNTFVGTFTTDENGYCEITLPYGKYYISETAPYGYIASSNFDININETKDYAYKISNTAITVNLRIKKIDKDSGKIIPESASFKIKCADGNYLTHIVDNVSSDIFVTDATGYVDCGQIPCGTYSVEEISAPKGYLLNATSENIAVYPTSADITVKFKDAAVKFPFTIYKTGEVLSDVATEDTDYGTKYAPIYKEKGLSGVVFDVYAKDDIKTPDGTVRVVAGTLVDTIATDNFGYAKTKDLYPGSYYAVEQSTKVGMALDSTPKYFSVSLIEALNQLTIDNDRQKVSLSFIKEFEKVPGQIFAPDEKTLFGLYTASDIKDYVGNIVISKDSLVDIMSVENGDVSCSSDIPYGSYYVKEISKANGYAILNGKFACTYSNYSVSEKNLTMVINSSNTVVNKLLTTDITVNKTTDYGSVEGFTFILFGQTVFGDTFDARAITNSDGKAIFENVPVGTYSISEERTGKAMYYVIPDTRTVSIVETDNLKTGIEVSIENKSIKKTIQIKKTAERGTLNGFEFSIVGTDVFGNKVNLTVMTDSDGIASAEVNFGEYIITEINNNKAKDFVLPAAQKVSVSADLDNTIVVYFENKLLTTDIVVKKVDVDGSPLTGAQFTLYRVEDDVVQATLETDINGIGHFTDIPTGAYYIKETKAPSGYEIAEDYSFLLDYNSIDKGWFITIVDEKSPKTGDVKNPFNYIIVMILSLSLMTTSVFVKKKNKAR